MCRTVFGSLIQYQKVKIVNQPYLPWQPNNMFMAPEGYIHIRDLHFKKDYSKENIIYRGIFIHEMTHILQYQKNINVLLLGSLLQITRYCSFGLYNPYKYILKKEKKFANYNIEQQGDIARDIYLQKIPNIILYN